MPTARKPAAKKKSTTSKPAGKPLPKMTAEQRAEYKRNVELYGEKDARQMLKPVPVVRWWVQCVDSSDGGVLTLTVRKKEGARQMYELELDLADAETVDSLMDQLEVMRAELGDG